MPSTTPRLLLAAESLAPGNGGICRLARLMCKVVADEMHAATLEARGITLSDTTPPEDIDLPVQACSGSRARFVSRVWKASLGQTHFLYDFVGMARAHCRFPPLRRPFLTWICGFEVWEKTRPDRIAWARRADLLLSISAYTRERADRAHGGLSHARICWLGTESDEPPARAHDFSGRPTVVILGRLDPEPWKGHHELIKAWPRVIDAVPDARLVIVGKGPGLTAAQSLAKASSAAGQIEFRGFVPDHQIDRVWDTATVYAMPGIMEGFGLVYVEAMRQGLPVVASIHDAAPEINLEGITGYNINLKCPDELPERLIYLLRNPDQAAQMGGNGRRRWEEHFRYSAFRKRFLEHLHHWINY